MGSLFRKRWVRVLAVVLGILGVLIVALSLVLDGVLTRKAQAEAASLSTRLGRPVTLTSVSTRFLGGLGATVSGLEVGPAAGEEAPLAEVQRLSVRIAATTASIADPPCSSVRQPVSAAARQPVRWASWRAGGMLHAPP